MCSLDKDELIKFLQENLKIDMDFYYTHDTLEIQIKLGDTQIASQTCSIPVYERAN